MYPRKYYDQIMNFREFMFGSEFVSSRDCIKKFSTRNYTCPKETEIVECREAENGEWKPIDD